MDVDVTIKMKVTLPEPESQDWNDCYPAGLAIDFREAIAYNWEEDRDVFVEYLFEDAHIVSVELSVPEKDDLQMLAENMSKTL